jgi:AcrR family transcriptional regulator
VGRWAPDAKGRLIEAALDLYQRRGFDETTVAEIAEQAGLTERTFFRYFADKREVLFDRASVLVEDIVSAVRGAAPAAPPIDAVAMGLEAASETLGDHRDFAVRRQAVIAANPELRERELGKLSSLAGAVAEALSDRGVSAATATLAAEAGMAVFKVAFDRWVEEQNTDSLLDLVRAAMGELREVAAAR